MDEKEIYRIALTKAKLDKIKEVYGDVELNLEHPEKSSDRDALEEKLNKLKETLCVDKKDTQGFFVSNRLVKKEINRTCPTCNTYSFEHKDDLYMNRYECCYKCYIEYIQGREDRWKKGWRPQKNEDNKETINFND